MKLAFIEPGLHVCGGIRRIIEVSNRLIDRKHAVEIYTPNGKRTNWIPIKAPIRKMSCLNKNKFDIVVFNLAEQYLLANNAHAKKKIFWVLAPEAMYKNATVPVRALQCDFFFMSNSQFTVDYIKKYRVKPIKYKIPIIPGGINPNHFKHVPTIAKQYHVLYYGSARPWKGSRLIENAIGTRRGKLKALKMEGLNTPQTHLYHLYNSATIYVSAGQVEGFNFPILEAMACGCPVVCTDDGGSRDFVRPNENALVVQRTALHVSDGIHALLNNKNLQRKLRNEGLKTAAESRFNWEDVTTKFEKIANGLLND
jgi:glycosyltransferase involved in cell wall biosynthesis